MMHRELGEKCQSCQHQSTAINHHMLIMEFEPSTVRYAADNSSSPQSQSVLPPVSSNNPI